MPASNIAGAHGPAQHTVSGGATMRGNLDIPFFRPLWRRLAVIAICLIWAIVEFGTNAPFWGIIALGFGGYAYWAFIHTYPGGSGQSPQAPDDRARN